MVRPLTDSRMLTQLADFFTGLCTIQTSTESQTTSGQVNPAWLDFAGHVDLPCRIAPAGVSEPRVQNQTYVIGKHTMILRGYYPLITAKMRAKVGSIYYNILGKPEFDGQSIMTRLTVELVK